MSDYQVQDILKLLSITERKLEEADASHYLLLKMREVIKLFQSEFNDR